MKIWFDILTPKQLLFFEPMLFKLRKNHQVLSTTRRYREVTSLAKIRKQNLIQVGKHGGKENYDKLLASTNRIKSLLPIVKKFSPDVTVSFTSPEAARISFGLGIKHITFSDSPHAQAVMKLTIPLVQKLLIPWIIPKKEFTQYGINAKNIIQYKAIDAAIISKRATKKVKLPFIDANKKTILFRVEEEQAAYSKESHTVNILKEFERKFTSENIVVISRYKSQQKRLKKLVSNNVKIINMSYDGKVLLENSDVFVGSGGTMTAESAFLGIPTVSFSAVPNLIEDYLVKKGLVKRAKSTRLIVKYVREFLEKPNKNIKRVIKLRSTMEDPYKILLKTLSN